MTSNRPYREAMPSRVARLRMAQAVESQFDTSAVAAFEAILASADEEYRTARRSDFEPNYAEDLETLSGANAPAEPEVTRRRYSEPRSPDGSSATARRVRTALIASAVRDLTPNLSNT